MSSQQFEPSNQTTTPMQSETTERQSDATRSGDHTGRMLSNILGCAVDIAIVFSAIMLIWLFAGT